MSPTPLMPPDTPSADLASLRAELDRLDDALHDLLMRRATVVGQVGALGVKGAVPLRPGREAAIIRRLLARHTGAFPPSSLVRLWRELLAGTTSIQRPLCVAVSAAAPEPDGTLRAVAREHFGALTPVHPYPGPAQAIAAVSNGSAAIAVLPAPRDDEAQPETWWTALLDQHEPRLHILAEPRLYIVARLPFWAPRPEGSPQTQALVVSLAPPDPSGADRSLLGLDLAPQTSRPQLAADLAAAGFTAGPVIVCRDQASDITQALVDVEGLVTDQDERLQHLQSVLRPPVVLGAYALPVGAAA